MKTVLIAIAGFLVISGTGVGAWLLTHKDDITNKINETKTTLTNDAKKMVLEQAQKYTPTGTCATVMTPAKHKATGVEFTFPSSCIPDGWEKV